MAPLDRAAVVLAMMRELEQMMRAETALLRATRLEALAAL